MNGLRQTGGFLIAIAINITLGCDGRVEPTTGKPDVAPDTPDVVQIVQATAEQESLARSANSRFALDLYQELAKQQPDKNLFFSPYSLSSALLIATEGAVGETATQMGQVLRLPETVRNSGADAATLPWTTEPIHAGQAGITAKIQPSPNAPYELRIANALWVEQTFPFQQPFLATAQKYYGGILFPVDFRHNSAAAQQQINRWVAQQTNDRIKDLIADGILTEHTRLAITNAVYFKGEWLARFKADATKPDSFYLPGSKPVQVPLMEQTISTGYAAFNEDGSYFETPQYARADAPDKDALFYPGPRGFSILELPYKGPMSLVLLVPRSTDGLPDLEGKLSAEQLTYWFGKLEKRNVQVHLPKFKLETDYDLKKPLESLGMVRAFQSPSAPDAAQFDRLTSSQSPDEKLYISAVRQKAFIEVNEEGSEAAAATVVAFATDASNLADPFTLAFRADKPFLFLIRDTATRSILFMGRMVNPESR